MDTAPSYAVLSAMEFWDANIETVSSPVLNMMQDIDVSTRDCLPVISHGNGIHRQLDILHLPTARILHSTPIRPGLLCKAYSKGTGLLAHSYMKRLSFKISINRIQDETLEPLFRTRSCKEIYSLALHTDELRFAAGRQGDTVHGTCPNSRGGDADMFVLDHADDSVAYATALCGPDVVLSGTRSGGVLLWDLRAGQRSVARFTTSVPGAAVRALRATEDQRKLVVLHDDCSGLAQLAAWDCRMLAGTKRCATYKFSEKMNDTGPIALFDIDETKTAGLLVGVSTMGDLGFWDVEVGGEAVLEFGATEEGVPSELAMFGWDDESTARRPGVFVKNSKKSIILTPGNDEDRFED